MQQIRHDEGVHNIFWTWIVKYAEGESYEAFNNEGDVSNSVNLYFAVSRKRPKVRLEEIYGLRNSVR